MLGSSSAAAAAAAAAATAAGMEQELKWRRSGEKLPITRNFPKRKAHKNPQHLLLFFIFPHPSEWFSTLDSCWFNPGNDEGNLFFNLHGLDWFSSV